MRLIQDEQVALAQLGETLRHQSHGKAGTIRTISSLFSAKETESTLEQSELEKRIVAYFKEFIPDHHVHNTQKNFALSKIAGSQLTKLDVQTDLDTINSVTGDIHSKRSLVALKSKNPLTARPVDVERLVALIKPLKDYTSITLTDTTRFPHIELLGYRSDNRPVLRQQGDQKFGRAKQDELQQNNLRSINETLDRIVPASPYYNEPRQMIIDQVLRHGDGLEKWLANEKANARESAKGGDRQFIANPAHFMKLKATQPIDDTLQAMALDQQRNTGYAARLTPQAAVSIGKLIEEHCQIGRDGEQRNTEAPSSSAAARRPAGFRDPFHVPQAIRQAVLTPEPSMPNARPEAARLAVEIAANVNAIIAPRRGNFAVRNYFLNEISQKRDVFAKLSMADQPADTSPALEQFKQTFRHAFEHKRPEIEQLAQKLGEFHDAWRDKSAVRTGQGANQPVATAPHLLGSGQSRQAKGQPSPVIKQLKRAADAQGQGRLDMMMFKKPKSADSQVATIAPQTDVRGGAPNTAPIAPNSAPNARQLEPRPRQISLER